MRTLSLVVSILVVSLVGLVGLVVAQQPAVTVTATPATVVQGEATAVTTLIRVHTPSGGTTELTTTETLAPATTTDLTASVGSEQGVVRITVVPALPTPPVAASWVSILASTGSPTVVDARGFLWKVPYDAQNREFLLYMSQYPSPGGPPSSVNTGIYSDDIIAARLLDNTINWRVLQNVTSNADGCNENDQPTGRNPAVGHPRGMLWSDPIARKVFSAWPLCLGQTVRQTSIYNTQTQQMEQPITVGMDSFPNGIQWGYGAEYVASYGKTVIFLGDVWWSVYAYEFDSATNTFTNIGAQVESSRSLIAGADGISCDVNKAPGGVVSTHCPILKAAMGTFSDGTHIWLLGGFNNSGPSGDLYRYHAATKVMTKMAPSGPVPPLAEMSVPFCAMDTKRSRLVCLLGTNDLWQYSLAQNQWSQFTAAGAGPVLDPTLGLAYQASRAAGYDPSQDAMIFVQSLGQGKPPNIFRLQFAQQN